MTTMSNSPRIPKRSRSARLVLMGVAPLMLTACEQPQEAFVYPDAEACIAAGVVGADDCRAAYDQALASSESNAPQYPNRADCVTDFSEAQCSTSPQQGFFLPLMGGFLLGRALDGGRAYPQPLYRPRNGEWTTPGGYTIGRESGRVLVDPSATKPQRAITQSRAGFGSRAAARGSWGG